MKFSIRTLFLGQPGQQYPIHWRFRTKTIDQRGLWYHKDLPLWDHIDGAAKRKGFFTRTLCNCFQDFWKRRAVNNCADGLCPTAFQMAQYVQHNHKRKRVGREAVVHALGHVVISGRSIHTIILIHRILVLAGNEQREVSRLQNHVTHNK